MRPATAPIRPVQAVIHPPLDTTDPFAEWPTVRHQIRAAMAERGVDYAQLGALLGYAPDTTAPWVAKMASPLPAPINADAVRVAPDLPAAQ